MKPIILAFALLISSAAAQASATDLTGQYGWNAGYEKVLVATVTKTDQKLTIKFRGGCKANLTRVNDAYVGSCLAGRAVNFDQIRYTAELKMRHGVSVLKWRAIEYGDTELGFDSFHYAVKF